MSWTMLTVHIAAGAAALLAGYVALGARKGGALHRKSGALFFYTMVVMGLMGSLIAALQGPVPEVNVPVGVLTAYLTVTGVVALRKPAAARSVEIGLLVVVLAVLAAFLAAGISSLTDPRSVLHGLPGTVFLLFGLIALLAAIGDVRTIRAGGAGALRGAPRLTRHLWRMCVALLIAAFSFFLGQAKVIPEPIRILPLLAVPPLAVLAALLYWLWRISIRRSLHELGTAAIATARQDNAASRRGAHALRSE